MKFKIRILGKRWTVRFLRYKAFKYKYGKNYLGITVQHKKRIDLCLRYCDIETIAHELTHAYINEICLTPTSISADDLEEAFCDLIAKHGGKLLKQSKDIFRAYSKR